LKETDEKWTKAKSNQFVVFVWLGSPKKNEKPRYWIADKREVGLACQKHPAHGTSNWERRFSINALNKKWENDWAIVETH